MTTEYKNKYFSLLGDSISTLAGYNPPDNAVFYEWENMRASGVFTAEDTWWGKVINDLGGKLLINESFSGRTVCKLPQWQIESYGCSDLRTGRLGTDEKKPDVIMILMGINDWGWGVPIYPNGEKDGLDVFAVAYSEMLKKIKANYPHSEIWCLTLPKSKWSKHPEIEISETKSGGKLNDYGKAIRACGGKAGCRVLDIYRPQECYDTIDGFHPTADGMECIANAVLCALRRGECHDN